MKWKVKSSDGELEYSTFGEVERAYQMGLIEGEDELLEEGTTRWRKANTIPLLVNAARREPPGKSQMVLGLSLAATALALMTLYFIQDESWILAATFGLIELGIMSALLRVTFDTKKKN